MIILVQSGRRVIGLAKHGKSMNEIRYEIITQEDEEGNLIIPFPMPLLKSLGWKEGDNVTIDIKENGELYLRKI